MITALMKDIPNQILSKECIEILFFISIAFYIIRWISADPYKKMFLYFLGYCTIFFTAHTFKLSNISFFLYHTITPTVTLFILMHQHILQRTGIALRKTAPNTSPNAPTDAWIDNLLRMALVNFNEQYPFHVLITRHDAMTDYMTMGLVLDMPCTRELTSLLTTSSLMQHAYTIVCDHHGIVRGINGRWHHTQNISAHPIQELSELDVYYTTHTDAITIYGDPLTRTFSMTINGKVISCLSLQQTRAAMVRHVYTSASTTQKTVIKQEREYAYAKKNSTITEKHR